MSCFKTFITATSESKKIMVDLKTKVIARRENYVIKTSKCKKMLDYNLNFFLVEKSNLCT